MPEQATPVRLAAGSGRTFGIDDLACAAATTLGFWSDEGLAVSWTPVHGGVAAIAAVNEGEVDVSYGGLGPLIKSRAEGNEVCTFVSMARGLAQNLVVRHGIDAPDDLMGASWAIDGIDALSHHMARLTVRALGMDESQISWRVAGPPPERIAMLLNGEVDASLLRVEEAASLALEGRLACLLDSAELGRLVPTQPHGVLGARRTFVTEAPETVLRLIRGMLRASRALHEDYGVFRDVCAAHLTVDLPEDHMRTIWKWEHDAGGFAVNGELSPPHWTRQLELYHALYPQLPQVVQDDLLIRGPLEQVLEELGRHESGFDQT